MLQELFRSKLRAKLLSCLFLSPAERFYARQLEAVLGESQGNISRELARLESLGIVVAERTGRQKFYTANEECPVFEELQGIVLKTAGLADVLKQALKGLDGVRVAFVYGGFAERKPSPQSDVDVMVIGKVSFTRIVEALLPAQDRLRRDINPVVYSVAEFRRRLRGDHHFVSAVVEGPKIFLVGNEDELRRVAG